MLDTVTDDDDFDEMYNLQGQMAIRLPDGSIITVSMNGKVNANLMITQLISSGCKSLQDLPRLCLVEITVSGKEERSRIVAGDELPLMLQLNWTAPQSRLSIRPPIEGDKIISWAIDQTAEDRNELMQKSRQNSKLQIRDRADVPPDHESVLKRASYAIVREGSMLFRQDFDGLAKGTWTECVVSLENTELSIFASQVKEDVLSTIFLTRTTVEELPQSTFPGKHCFLVREAVGDHQDLIFEFAVASTEDAAAWLKILSLICNLFNNKSKRISHALSRRKSTRMQQKSLEDFEFLKVIGKGHFGKVLLCAEKKTGQVFAIKVLKKTKFLNEKDLDHLRAEQRVLRGLHHPFIVALHYAFQSEDRLYLVMEYVNGGELYYHISNEGSFEEPRAKFYAAEILLALHHLHRLGIVYRDLKLENVLLDGEGHIKITDFGLCKDELGVGVMTSTICGTTEYMAPEALLSLQYGFAVDWWSFGVVLYEMLCGVHPFYSENRDELFQNILHLELAYPQWISTEACNIIDQLLQRNPVMRLGSGPDDGSEIRRHKFFKGMDFDKLLRREIAPPFKPLVSSNTDASNFDHEFTQLPPVLTPLDKSHLQNVPNFDDFAYDRMNR